jgi:branched-chain amino acid transport system ATP-binding protein
MSVSTLKAQGVRVQFGGLVAVDDVSFEARSDRILSVIGPNGAGKTTLFAVLSGFVKPTSGTVALDGETLTGEEPHQIARRGIARTFQIVRPFRDLTALDNAIVGAYAHAGSYREAREIADRMLEEVGLYAKRSFLASYLTLPDLKLLEVAKALATRPKFLLLDEVMSGLNLKEQHDVAHMLEKIHERGTGILLVEHSLAIVQRMSARVVCLDSGRKIAEGTAAEVMGSPAVQAAYMGIDAAPAEETANA